MHHVLDMSNIGGQNQMKDIIYNLSYLDIWKWCLEIHIPITDPMTDHGKLDAP